MGAHSPPLANPSLEEKPIPCFQNLPDQLTSHKWLHSSPKKWLEVPMMMTPSLNPLMHSKFASRKAVTCGRDLLSFCLEVPLFCCFLTILIQGPIPSSHLKVHARPDVFGFSIFFD